VMWESKNKIGRIYQLKLFLSTPWMYTGEQTYGSTWSQLLQEMEVRVLNVSLWQLYPQGKNSGTQWRGGMVGSRAGLGRRKCPPTEIRTLMRQNRSNNTDFGTSGYE
jgi:hypothetical protein